MTTSSYTHRIDSDLRAQSEAIYSALGMSLGTAINVFLKKSDLYRKSVIFNGTYLIQTVP